MAVINKAGNKKLDTATARIRNRHRHALERRSLEILISHKTIG